MEKDFEKHGIGHYQLIYIVSAGCATINLMNFLKKNHPEILDEVMSEFGVLEHTVQYTLNHIVKCAEIAREITLEVDELITEKPTKLWKLPKP